LVLLVPKKHPVTDVRQLWARDTIDETLITFQRGDAVHTHLQEGLDALGVEWFPGIEVNSTRLIECYVENGYGIGATVATPDFRPTRKIRALALRNFPPVVIGAAWIGKLSPIPRQLLRELELEARKVKRRGVPKSG
jgi:DNA-binding transcriptional LysR family regulator